MEYSRESLSSLVLEAVIRSAGMDNVPTCHVPTLSPTEGLLERGGTAELMETIEPTSTWRCSLLIRKFNLETDSTISPGTKTDVSAVATSCMLGA